jgi:translation initiation factor 2 beta subunit (eIF-2beta)/eIF-5
MNSNQINMNGQNDPFYRYKMPTFIVTPGGKGNGIYTTFNNIDKICDAICHPEEVILKYIASITGSNLIMDRLQLTGTHSHETLEPIILEYIKYLVICPKCSIPETIPKLIGNKKNQSIVLTCSACKSESVVQESNKHITKGIDVIIKYLKTGKEWKITKGNMVIQNTSSNDFNPFDM